MTEMNDSSLFYPQLCTGRCTITLPSFSQDQSGIIPVNSTYIFVFMSELFTQHVTYTWGFPNPLQKVVTFITVVSPFVEVFNNMTPASGEGWLYYICTL
jgi:hypothetical protein